MNSLFLALIVARSLDATTTCVALNRGGHDIMPWNTSCPSVVGVQAALTALQINGLHHLSIAHHPKLAHVLGSIAIGTEGVAVTWNLYQIRKR